VILTVIPEAAILTEGLYRVSCFGVLQGVKHLADRTYQVSVPTPLLQYGLNKDDIQHRVNEWLVLSLFTEGRISSAKAARLLGISRVDFLDLLRTHGIAYVDYGPDELAEEFAAVESPEVQK